LLRLEFFGITNVAAESESAASNDDALEQCGFGGQKWFSDGTISQ
jgi:hypothetical protein